MARPWRIEFPGAVYHVMNRGDRREAICRDDTDRELFLRTLTEACGETGWQVHALCLMPNLRTDPFAGRGSAYCVCHTAATFTRAALLTTLSRWRGEPGGKGARRAAARSSNGCAPSSRPLRGERSTRLLVHAGLN